MSHLLKQYRGQVDLVYIDPPFDSKADIRELLSEKGCVYVHVGTSISHYVKTEHMALHNGWKYKLVAASAVTEMQVGTLL